MRTVGIDLSASPAKTAVACVDWDADKAVLTDLVVGADDTAVRRLVEGGHQLGVREALVAALADKGEVEEVLRLIATRGQELAGAAGAADAVAASPRSISAASCTSTSTSSPTTTVQWAGGRTGSPTVG